MFSCREQRLWRPGTKLAGRKVTYTVEGTIILKGEPCKKVFLFSERGEVIRGESRPSYRNGNSERMGGEGGE
jgi:hypothetical protein